MPVSMGDCPRCWESHCNCVCRDPSHVAYEHIRSDVADSARLRHLAEQRIVFLEAQIDRTIKWLEANQPDVFRRGIWTAIAPGPQS